ncbi:hypothetical protein DL768_005079 [Monosporascus sp. mg162]|nr:hypothetical protein DL768_005079 [Monosporascus sp. mg162]
MDSGKRSAEGAPHEDLQAKKPRISHIAEDIYQHASSCDANSQLRTPEVVDDIQVLVKAEENRDPSNQENPRIPPNWSTGSSRQLWRYMKANVPEITIENIPKKGDRQFYRALPVLMGLPQVRDVAWNKKFRGKRFSDKHADNLVALAVYLTGKKAEPGCENCQGPFEGCIIPSDDVWQQIAQKACANHIYNWQKRHCSLNPNHSPSSRQRDDSGSVKLDDKPKSEVVELFSTDDQHSDNNDEPVSKNRRRATEVERGSQPTLQVPVSSPPKLSPALSMAGSEGLASGRALDDWEIAPGRIRAASGVNIAFSGSFLRHNLQPPVVHRGSSCSLGLNITTVRSAASHYWKPDIQAARLCTVTVGTVLVELEDKKFPSGPNAAFLIPVGSACKIQNRWADDATIHIVSINELQLATTKGLVVKGRRFEIRYGSVRKLYFKRGAYRAEVVPQGTARSPNRQEETEPRQQENADEHLSSFDVVSEVAETDKGKSVRSSVSHWDPEPGFAHVDGDIAGNGYNETTVDIIAVPCIGASAVDTWVRDPLKDGYFEAPSPTELQRYETVKELPARAVLSPAINRHLPKANQLWIRQGIRKEINTARVMLYRHRELTEGYTLDQAADDLLEHVLRMRPGQTKSRPIFFVCHSIGGVVAKLALVKASRKEELRRLIFDCHGMTFFSTPHRGSSYMSMPHLRESIQHLLHLEKPLPRSITDELRLGYKPLLHMHDQFKDIASELRIWTFYETIDSQLSGWGASDFDEVHFSAPLVSIKSCIIGTRAEQAFSLESNHANCASFGSDNLETMHSYLTQLRQAVQKAEYLSTNFVHTPLRLAEKVKLELIGFYEDPDSDEGRDIRLYVSKHFLKEFLAKGPEQCLQERLSTVAAKRGRRHLRRSKRGTSSRETDASGALGVLTNVQEFGHRIFGRHDSSTQGPPEDSDTLSPEIVVTSHPRPQVTGTVSEPPPATVPRRSRGLTVPSLSTPGFHRPSSRGSSRASSDGVSRTASDPGDTEVSPRSTGDARERDAVRDRDELPGINRKDHALAVKGRNERLSKASALQELTAGFSRPDPTRRKFMWIHLPFNNPHWVKVSQEDRIGGVNYSKLLGNDVWVKRHVQGRHANMHASYVKPGFAASSAVPYRFRKPKPWHRMAHARARPVPRDIAELESLESRMIWEYIGHDPPLNARRTLDQYGYPSLRDTYARDDDQMLYKLTKERVAPPSKNKQDIYDTGTVREQSTAVSPRSPFPKSAAPSIISEAVSYKYENEEDLESDILDGNVLMVDQLWLWAVDTTTLTTFFPKRESYPTEGPMFQQADLRNSVYNELNGDLTGRCENALDLAAFVVLHAVTVLLDRTSHPDLEIFRIFEEAIGVLSERMTFSLKGFRMQTFRGKMSDESSGGSDFEDNTSASIKRRHQQELEQAERENREHTSALLELRDMDDELNTMRNLFTEQQTIIQTMKARYDDPELRHLTLNGRAFLGEALERLEEYKKQTNDMIDRVETTRKDYEKLLEMVQRQAQVDEVRWSRLQTELASSQNLSVMIFTTFTVIFLPLSFFTSLFGMNTAEWGGADDNYLSLRTIGAVSLPASALIVAASLVAAFSSRAQGLVRAAIRLLRRAVEGARPALTRLWPEPARRKRAARKRRLAREQMEARRQRRRERGYDFWETVRAERGSRYEIPELNRKKATQRRLAGTGTWKRMVKERW